MEKSPATTTETATAPPLPTTTTPSPREEKGEETTTTVENENTDPFSLADDGIIIIDTNNNNNMEDNSEDNAASASASASATPTDNSKDDGKDGGKSDDGNEVTTSYYSHDNDVEKVTVNIDEDEDVDIVDDIVDDVHNNNDSINVNINGDDNGNENDNDDCNDIDKGNENDNEKGDGDNDNDNDNDSNDNDNDNDNETTTTYLDGMPIFNYSRIISSGLPLPREGVKKEDDPLTSPSTDDINDNNLDPLATSTSIRRRQQQPRSSCSKLTIARVDPEELIAATKNAMIITTANSDGHNNTNTNTTAERVDIDTTNTNNIYYNSKNRNRNRNEEALLLSSDLWQQPHLIVACGWDSSSKLSSSSSSSSSSSPMKRRGKITFTRVHQQHQFDSRKNGTDTATATNSNSSNNNGSSSSLSSSPSVVFVTPSKTNTGVVPLSADSGSGGSDPAFTTGSTTTTSSSSSNNNSNKNCNYIYNSNASTELYIQEKEFNSNSWSSGPIYDDTSIVDMSFDASGTALGAIDEGGHCAIWEFKYTTSLQSNLLVFGDTTTTNSNTNSNTNKGMENNNNNNNRSTMLGEEGPSTPTSTPTSSRPQASKTGSSTPARSAGNNNMFSSFMSALTGKPQVDERSRSAGSLFTNTNNNNDESSNSDSTTNNTIQNNNNNNIIELIPSLTAEISYQSSINYPASWGPPTSMVIDPAYKRPRKREKSLLVGFSNGRLVLTKRGTFFNRRNDTVIYQASHAATGGSGGSSRKKVSHSYRGIEKVIWRGSLVAWADATGIKLMDMDQLTRIAHIDRPAGARPTLHPSVRDIRPSLVFETSQHLLVGWGDCLMQIHVEEHHDNDHDHRHSGSSSRSVSSGRSDGSVGSSSAVVKKRQTVACTMAWELDCVACDVVPLDADHVAVLGLVPPRPAVVNDEGTDNDNDDNNDDEHINGKKGTTTPYLRKNELEMQVLSRKDGTITHCDALPLIKDNTSVSSPTSSSSSSNQIVTSIDSVLDYRLLSSFALPRMEEAEETKVLKDMKGANDMGFIGIDINFDMNQRLFADVDSSAKNMIEFRDPHLQWNIQSIPHDDDEYGDERTDFVCCDTADDDDDDDDRSIDSDDYECILRPMETIKPLQQQIQATAMAATGENQCSPPPAMVVCTDSDAILSLTSTMDDAVESSLARHKYALALFRGLLHKRQLRRYDMNDLISRYLRAVLRINHQSNKNECTVLEEQQPAQRITVTATATTKTVVTPPPRSLSLRRMQLAVKAMPVLLGDRIELWELWCRELENIPGSLFILRNYLPVRDPILPSNLYVRILEKMLTEVEHISNNSKKKKISLIDIHNEAANHFLESLLAWGSTKVLKEYISFYKYNKERQNGEKSFDKDIRATQIALQRRYLQTAAGYLIFPVQDVEEELQVSAPRYEVHNNDTNDSLFDISELISVVASRVPLVASPKDFGNLTGTDEAHLSYTLTPNNHTCLAAMARLRIMQGEYDLGLKCFLAIGAIHSKDSLQLFEKTAIRVVNGTNITTEDSTSSLIDSQSYEFVMSFIESQNLNQFLLEKEFLLSTSTESKLFMPIFALIRLVGLRRVGNFLIENCVEPDFSYNMTLREANKKAFKLPNSPNDDSNEEPKAILHRGPLPIDKVAEQLKSSPALLHWYLHLVFTRRPDFYINFRTTSTPSKVVTSLHPIHFQSYVDFAGEMRDSSKVLAGTEGYKVESKTTPLLTFLRATLPLGGVLPVDARRVLEIERSKDSNNNNNVVGGGGDGNEIDSRESSCSPIFALELAYVIEKYNEQTETDALGILNLYLKGVQSIQLAVSYAQRQKQFSIVLWDHLILYCLKKASDGGVMLFGELLEAAALSGADVARLVERIPPGMVIEGLRPRLVAAVADYRMKLEIYEAAMAAGSEEEVNLMREVGHRVRRGVRYDLEKNRQKSFAELIHEKTKKNTNRKKVVASIENNNIIIISNNNSGEPPGTASHKISKTRIRRGHQRLAYSIPRRLLNNEN